MLKTFVPIFAGALVVACGEETPTNPNNDGGTNPPGDAGALDCTRHENANDPRCRPPPDQDPTLAASEGGEVRLEVLTLKSGARIQRMNAFFMDGMTPERYPTPAVGSCVKMDKNDTWPRAQGTNRDYVDAGKLTLRGGPAPLVIDAPAAGTDFLLRTHDLQYIKAPAADNNFIADDAVYAVELGGSADFEPVIWADAIFMPDVPTPTNPVFTATVALTAGRDLTLNWTVAQQSTDDFDVLGFVGFVVPGKGVTDFCVIERDTGTFTVPASVVDGLEGAKGTALVATLAHKLVWLREGDEENPRRVDLLGINCFASPYERR